MTVYWYMNEECSCPQNGLRETERLPLPALATLLNAVRLVHEFHARVLYPKKKKKKRKKKKKKKKGLL